ncbi:MAG: hypothetical protein R3E87_02350 [Burkholderiaceae bacterium]
MKTSSFVRRGRWLAIAGMCVGLLACGGGGDSTTATATGSNSATSTGSGSTTTTKGVFTGYSATGPDNVGADGGGGDGGGSGDGGGGFGVGGSLGRIQDAVIIVTLADGSELGRAPVDALGLVTVRPGADYTGPLLVEVRGSGSAAYFDEARQVNLPYTETDSLRMVVSKPPAGLVVVTPLTNAAVRLLETQAGSAALLGNAASIDAANQAVADQINRFLPDTLKVASVIAPATLVDSTTAPNSLADSAADIYARALAAIAEAAKLFDPGLARPAAAFSSSFGKDMTDGTMDDRDASGAPIAADSGLGYGTSTLAANLLAGAVLTDQRYTQPSVAVTPAPTAAICPATYDQGGFQPVAATFEAFVAETPAAGSNQTTPVLFRCQYRTSGGDLLNGFEINIGGYSDAEIQSFCGQPDAVAETTFASPIGDIPVAWSTRRQVRVTAGIPETFEESSGVLSRAVAEGVGKSCP